MSAITNTDNVDTAYRGLYIIGGAAALIAGVIFRRNLGVAEIGQLIYGRAPPDTVTGWFLLLQGDRLLGLAMLNVFDIVDFALLGLMFLALYAALRPVNKGYALIATAMGLVGIAVYFASNAALSLLSLSDQFAAATTDAQRSALLAAGQAILATGNPGSIFPGTGIYMSFFLLAAAGLVFSILMLRSTVFSRATAYVGILASLCDLACCVTFAVVPTSCVVLVASAGLLLMIWHVLIGLRLVRIGRSISKTETGMKTLNAGVA
jgi:hypothetical protein